MLINLIRIKRCMKYISKGKLLEEFDNYSETRERLTEKVIKINNIKTLLLRLTIKN